MSYSIILSPRAAKEIVRLRKSGDKTSQAKLELIFHELVEHPLTGTGKPEPLKRRANTYSRRLNGKDRIVYSVHDDIVEVHILQILGHYDDK